MSPMRYFIAGNFWLLMSLLAFVGRKYERSSPDMYSVFGAGRYFSAGEYALLTVGLLSVAVVFFALYWIHECKSRAALTRGPASERVGAVMELVTEASRLPFGVWLPVLSIYTLFMLGNVVLPSVFWRSGSESFLEYLAMFSSGVLISEFAVLGAWLSMSSERLSRRIPIVAALLFLATSSLIVGVHIADNWDGPPAEWCLFFYGVSLVKCVACAIPLGLLRWALGWHIAWAYKAENVPCRSQLSIAYILGCTTVIAVLIALTKAFVPSSRGGNEFAQVAWVCAIFVVYTTVLFVPSFWFGMKRPAPRWVIILLALVLLVLVPATMSLVHLFLGGTSDDQEIRFLCSYSFGFISSVWIVLWALRRLGFVLRRSPRK